MATLFPKLLQIGDVRRKGPHWISLTLARQKVIFLATAPEFPRQTDVSLALIGPPTTARSSIASGRSISVTEWLMGELLYVL